MTRLESGLDVINLREQVYGLIQFTDATPILDIGCGTGYDLSRFGEFCGPNANLIGIDTSHRFIRKAKQTSGNDSRLRFIQGDVKSVLPFENESFDIVYSSNLLECIADKEHFIAEVSRILKPGGQVVFSHYDWDSQIFNGYDKPLIRKTTACFSDWKQDWMDVSDGWMGRKMYGLFKNNPDFSGAIIPYVLVNTEYLPDLYGYQRIRDVTYIPADS